MRLKGCREKAALRQTDVACALNRTQGTISSWETGRTLPSADKLPVLARLYGCTIDELLSEPEQEISQDDRTA